MAFPTFAAAPTVSSRGSNAVQDSVTLPASIAAGDLILVWHASDITTTRTWASPWVELLDGLDGDSTSSIGIAYLIASGGETAVLVDKSVTERFTALAVRIAAASWHGTTPPEVSTSATGSDTAPDPDSVTASWGSDDNLFIAMAEYDVVGATTVTAYPTSYADNQTEATQIDSCGRVAIASRELAAASDDPAAFTIDPTQGWRAATVVVRPAAAASPVESGAGFPFQLQMTGFGT